MLLNNYPSVLPPKHESVMSIKIRLLKQCKLFQAKVCRLRYNYQRHHNIESSQSKHTYILNGRRLTIYLNRYFIILNI